MAGVDVSIRLSGFDAPIEMLQRIDRNLDNLDPMKRALGHIVAEAIRSYIELGGTYDKTGGDVFAPTDSAYAALEGKGHQRPLYWTGDLYNSIHEVLTSYGVAVGSDLDYAPWVMLADGVSQRKYAREEVNGQWIPRGSVVELTSGSAFVAAGSGFKPYATVIQRRDVLAVFVEDLEALLRWFDDEVLQGVVHAFA